jgi:hypothetical protein
MKKYWMLRTIFGLLLGAISIPISSYLLSVILRADSINLYIAWGISSAIPALLVSFPAGYFLLNDKPFINGLWIGLVALVFLLAVSNFYEIIITKGFITEYISLSLASGIAAYFGRTVRRRISLQ